MSSPTVSRRRVSRTGDPSSPSMTITLPAAWRHEHQVEPGQELVVVTDRHMLVLAPGAESEIDDILHGAIREMARQPRRRRAEAGP